jgi:hypothetical protein
VKPIGKLYHIQTALEVFYLRYERLRTAELFGQCGLSHFLLFSFRNKQSDQGTVAVIVDGLHPTMAALD